MSQVPVLSELEEKLRSDTSGQFTNGLKKQLTAALSDVRNELNTGVTQERFSLLSAQKQAVESAFQVIDNLWTRFHHQSTRG